MYDCAESEFVGRDAQGKQPGEDVDSLLDLFKPGVDAHYGCRRHYVAVGHFVEQLDGIASHSGLAVTIDRGRLVH